MYISHQQCVGCLSFQPYNVWILLKTVIKYLHWSICKTIQMLYHGKAATCRCMYITSTMCRLSGIFSYNIWILLKTIIKYLRSICKTIQMLYHGTTATAIHIYTMHVDHMYVNKLTRLFIDRIDINFMDIYSFSELQIIFESNAYLRPNFWLNAEFQISKSIFTPCNFSQCWKGRYYCFEVPYLNFF